MEDSPARGPAQGSWAGCKELTRLSLEGTKVSDAGLAHVKDCNNLKSLDVRGTKVSAAGIETLRKALPKCKIVCNGGEGGGK